MTSFSGNPDDRPRIAQTPFSIEVESAEGAQVVRPIGSCTMEVAESLSRRLLELASTPQPLVVIDLAKLDFIESTGLGGLVSGYLRARRQGGEIRLLSPAPAIRELLELTRLTQLFQVHGTLKDALRRES